MWPWQADHSTVVYMPRKPSDYGVKVLTLCFNSTYSGRPYCFHFVPDVQNVKIGPYDALNKFKEVVKNPPLPITGDSWFGMMNWIRANSNVPATFAVQSNQSGHLWRIFTKDLKKGESRTFSNGPLTATVFADVAIMKTISSVFEVIESNGTNETSVASFATETSRLFPQLSEDALESLCDWKNDDLKKLLAAMGRPTSKLF